MELKYVALIFIAGLAAIRFLRGPVSTAKNVLENGQRVALSFEQLVDGQWQHLFIPVAIERGFYLSEEINTGDNTWHHVGQFNGFTQEITYDEHSWKVVGFSLGPFKFLVGRPLSADVGRLRFWPLKQSVR